MSGGEKLSLNRYGARLREWQKGLTKLVVDTLLPPRCPLSDEPVAQHGTFAPSAWSGVQRLSEPWCSVCGFPFEQEALAEALCVSCAAPSRKAGRLTGRGGLTKIRSAFAYSDAIAPAILRLKYADRTDGVVSFARAMALAGREMFAEAQGPLIVPVPLHRARLRQRHYNQAGLLASELGRLTGQPVDHTMLVRSRKTPPQGGTSRDARYRNVAGAFSAARPDAIHGQSIILVDDVLTSGATLLACARVLRQAGARKVFALTLARVVKTAQETPYSE
ncbi:MAG: double zinc ribbon domain-containing protein [Parvularcula sp.]